MNKQTLILLLILCLFLIPTGIVTHAYSTDRFDRLSNEGFVAYSVAYLQTAQISPEIAPTPKVDEKPKTCSKCNGTKQVRSPDNVTNIPCPCGSNCKCVGMKAEAPKPVRSILVLSASWCKWCKYWEGIDEPNLKKNGWTFGKDKNIQIVDVDKEPELAKKYGYDNLPAYVVIEDGKELGRVVGYLHGIHFLKLYEMDTRYLYEKGRSGASFTFTDARPK